MRMVMTLAALLLAIAPPPQTPFRAQTDVVRVDVLVKAGDVALRDLKASDFDVRDNGVVQHIDAVSAETVPVDLTLVLDMSSSVRHLRESFVDQIRQIAGLLRPDDRVRLLAFGTRTTQVFGFQSGASALSFDRLESGMGITALDDALMLGLAWMPESGRRHLVAGFTDGGENASLVERQDLLAAATRAPALLYLVLPRAMEGMTPPQPGRAMTHFVTQGGDTLRVAAESTGGGLLISEKSSRILDGFKTVFETFRSGYVLQYTPRGVERSGWHELSVTVTKTGKYDIHARKGYAGDR